MKSGACRGRGLMRNILLQKEVLLNVTGLVLRAGKAHIEHVQRGSLTRSEERPATMPSDLGLSGVVLRARTDQLWGGSASFWVARRTGYRPPDIMLVVRYPQLVARKECKHVQTSRTLRSAEQLRLLATASRSAQAAWLRQSTNEQGNEAVSRHAEQGYRETTDEVQAEPKRSWLLWQRHNRRQKGTMREFVHHIEPQHVWTLSAHDITGGSLVMSAEPGVRRPLSPVMWRNRRSVAGAGRLDSVAIWIASGLTNLFAMQ